MNFAEAHHSPQSDDQQVQVQSSPELVTVPVWSPPIWSHLIYMMLSADKEATALKDELKLEVPASDPLSPSGIPRPPPNTGLLWSLERRNPQGVEGRAGQASRMTKVGP